MDPSSAPAPVVWGQLQQEEPGAGRSSVRQDGSVVEVSLQRATGSSSAVDSPQQHLAARQLGGTAHIDQSRRTRWRARPHTSIPLLQTRVQAQVQGAHLPAWGSRDHRCARQLRLTMPSNLAPLLHPRSQASAPSVLTLVPARHMREQLPVARLGAQFPLRRHVQPEHSSCRVRVSETVHHARRTPQQTRRAALQSMQQAGRPVAWTARPRPCLLLARQEAAPRALACQALRARPTARLTRPCARLKARCAEPAPCGRSPALSPID